MLAAIAAVLIVAWLLAFFAFHVASGVIHFALVVAFLVIVLQFLRNRHRTA